MSADCDQDPGYAIRYSSFTRILFWILLPVPWFAVVLIYAMVMPRGGFERWSSTVFWTVVAGAYALSTIIHECGHALAAWQLNRPVSGIFVWPVCAERARSGWRFRWRWRPFGGGSVDIDPVDQEDHPGDAWIFFAGPLANLVAFLGTIPALYLLGAVVPWLSTGIALFGLMNAVAFYYALNPRGKHPLTDGDWILIALWQRRRQLVAARDGIS